ncbi:hypothetical protein HCEG_06230 [Histoplasma capsulatum var. duboisii H88]|uniref:Uncharacterized protein n=2 Tax=Ajellomyces capsulatus TaxID=5037 RepID=F0UPR2_AJEC8|nr:hypothetical protein HCDG_04772 [Histoplasma capsulatum H143]EGC47015.1 hypothetical protein HCEG_06230 [Histoplasma capsulatum var. duboisii H88]QSS53186.1 hypothetical protein I7I53_00363 [Histoplasma capsulatum var. duboisii H88]
MASSATPHNRPLGLFMVDERRKQQEIPSIVMHTLFLDVIHVEVFDRPSPHLARGLSDQTSRV